MSTKNSDGHVSKFAAALAKRPRKTYTYDLAELFGLEGAHPVALRLPTVGETNEAIEGAHAYVFELSEQGKVKQVLDDPEIKSDAKSLFVANAFCRDPNDPQKPLFPSTSWLRDNLAPEEVAVFVNLANEVRAQAALSRVAFTDEALKGFVHICANGDPDAPVVHLAGVSREYIVHLAIMLALMVAEMQLQLEAQAAPDRSPAACEADATGAQSAAEGEP